MGYLVESYPANLKLGFRGGMWGSVILVKDHIFQLFCLLGSFLSDSVDKITSNNLEINDHTC